MNVFEVITGRVVAALKRVIRESERPAEIDFSRVAVDPPREAAHGELSTNAAMVTAKPLGMNPKELAATLAAILKEDPDIVSAAVAGPGFINLTLTPSFWHGFLARVLFLGPAYGRVDIGKGEAVNVEYVSTNPTGPIHVGHCRGAVVGDVLANLLEATGHQVTREYYINDAGAQVDVLARSSFLRYREALGEEIGTIPAGLYPGDYLKAVGSALAAEYGRDLASFPEERWLPLVRVKAVDMMMALIKEDLAALNVTHETFFSERSLTEGAIDRVEQAIEFLRAKGDIYVGRLPPPKGQPSEDWEDREQTLFRSTAFGDDIDRPLKKSDGTNTYFAADIAYHYDKFLRGFSQMIDVLGADHGGYVKRMQAAVKAISGGAATLDVKICQLVKLYRAGEPVKMSKRSGDFVTLREVVDEVGPDAVRFMMVFKKSDTPIDFDFVKVTEQSKENPVFYVQYAHARAASIFRQAATLEEGDLGAAFLKDLVNERVDAAYLAPLTDSGEMALVRRFADFPRTIESAARSHEPHRIAFYLYELAGEFHAQWNRGNENQLLRFVNPGHPHLTLARLALVHATRLILSCGLAILGVQAPDEMR